MSHRSGMLQSIQIMGKGAVFFEEKAYEMVGFIHYADGALYRSAVIK